VLLTTGNVLVQGNSGRLYEFDGTALHSGPFCFGGIMLMLPTGQALIGGSQVYTPVGNAQLAWAPVISSYPTTVHRGSTYTLNGTQFNGMSQAAAYGDELETATNYPLVRLTNRATGHVFYARTHDHSTMGVQTGKTPTTTHFDVPTMMETGTTNLQVVTNGIPSAMKTITVQ
jgi:hypothetical protein